jgi:hypothetical protein
MAMPFDVTMKDLVQSFVHDYELQLGLADLGPLTPLNVDLSTLTAAGCHAHARRPRLAGPFQTVVAGVDMRRRLRMPTPARQSKETTVSPGRWACAWHPTPTEGYSQDTALFIHQVQAGFKCRIVVLLCPAADDPSLNGKVHYRIRGGKDKMDSAFSLAECVMRRTRW